MAQDYGAAQGLVDTAKRYVRSLEGLDKVRRSAGLPSPYDRSQDTSWHDSMVRSANESFRKAAESSRKPQGRTTSRKGSGRSSKR